MTVVPRDDVERRVLRGILTLGVQRDSERGWQHVRSSWPAAFEVLASIVKAQIMRPDRSKPRLRLRADDLDDFHVGPEDYEPVRPRFEPTREDVADYLTALGWAARLSRADYEIVVLSAYGWDYRSIGRRHGRDDDWARARYAAAILQCWRAANAAAFADARSRAVARFARRA